MNPIEVHSAVAEKITEARDKMLAWFDAPADLRAWLPANGRWSVDEILHHTCLTSHYLLILIEKSTKKCLNAKARGEELVWPETYALIPENLQEAEKLNAFTWHRPDHMDPRLHPATGDVRATFLEQMQRCKAILASLDGGWGIAHTTMMTVNDIGRLDVYQYLVFLCVHALRHCDQMAGNEAAFSAA